MTEYDTALDGGEFLPPLELGSVLEDQMMAGATRARRCDRIRYKLVLISTYC